MSNDEAIPRAYTLSEAMTEHLDRLEQEIKEPEKYRPIPIPNNEDLTKVMAGGIPRSDPFVIVVLAKEKLGKTTVALTITDAWCGANEKGAIYFCLEEMRYQIAERMLSKYRNISRREIYQRNISQDEIGEMRKWADHFKSYPFYLQDQVFDPKRMTRQALDLEVGLMVVDNLQITDMSSIAGREKREKIENVSAGFRQVRNKFGLSVLIVSQEGQEGKALGSLQANRDADGLLLVKDYMKYEVPEGGGKKLIGVPTDNMREIEALRSRLPWSGTCYVQFDGDHSVIEDVPVKRNEDIDFDQINLGLSEDDDEPKQEVLI